MDYRQAICAAALPMLVAGCVLAPQGTVDERNRLQLAGLTYEALEQQRPLPPLSPQASWHELLERALLSNGELATAYFQWKAAVARIDVAAGYPNSNLSLNFDYMFSGNNMKGWDRTRLTLGVDPMQNLSLPNKVVAAGRVALDEARAAGERLEVAKFSIQQRLLTAYFDYALLAERIRLQQDLLHWLELAEALAQARNIGGATQQDVASARGLRQLEENRRASLQSQAAQQRVGLNGILQRPADAALDLPATLPTSRQVIDDDERLLSLGVSKSPELRALSEAVAGRQHALELARLQYIPDINPFAGINGGVTQVVGAAITFSTMLPQIRARIVESEAMLRASEATVHQAQADRGATYVATLLALRDNERQARFLEAEVLPLAQWAGDLAQQMYVAGSGMLAPVVESQRAVIEVRQAIATARMTREVRLVELEALAGVDIETLAPEQDAAQLAGRSL